VKLVHLCYIPKQTELSQTMGGSGIGTERSMSSSSSLARPTPIVSWLTRAPCHPNPCKQKWIAEFADETSKTIGSCENHWSCCSQDDQCVTSVLNCTIQNTNSTGLDPHCDYHGISVMPNNCDITIDVSEFMFTTGTSPTVLHQLLLYSVSCNLIPLIDNNYIAKPPLAG